MSELVALGEEAVGLRPPLVRSATLSKSEAGLPLRPSLELA